MILFKSFSMLLKSFSVLLISIFGIVAIPGIIFSIVMAILAYIEKDEIIKRKYSRLSKIGLAPIAIVLLVVILWGLVGVIMR